MRVYGVIGWKNSGKTGLMERLVAEITARGFSVSTVKHVHHDVDLDQPGKDTFRHRQAGAREVVLASKDRFALMVEHRGPEPDLSAVLSRMAPVDLILVEGYKRDSHRKLEVWRRETGNGLIQPGDPLVRAVATDEAGLSITVPVLDLNDTKAVADFILTETGLPLHHLATTVTDTFDTVAIVDWSASNGPSSARESADAIWIGTATRSGTDATYFRTRAEAEAHLETLIAAERAAGRRLLIGFDFAFGYPQGFAARLTREPSARAVWHWLADRITDEDNRNNRFDIAAEINASFGATGPFWACPANRASAHLTTTCTAPAASLGLPERRAADRAVKGAQPVWKLYTPGAVGSQSLMGLPMIHRLSQRPNVAVWPFDPIDTAPTVLAEVFPSLLAPLVAKAEGIKDRAQVTLLAHALLNLAQTNTLAPLLQTPPDPRFAEEGWILGAGHEAALLTAAGAP
jgi:molybdopterin-guanine dinucleotide biosynthesis protein B